jgi:phosphohistidine phosphatase SixA
MTATLERWQLGSPIMGVAVALWLGLSATSAVAQALSGASLVDALKGGGYVLVVRNAQSPEAVPEERRRAPGNLEGEREIDPEGQGQVSVIAYSLRELDIPVGETLHGPAFRSRQSANYLGRGKLRSLDTLAETADAAALAQLAATAPAVGHNTVIVTHEALIEKAFARDARDIGNAETLVFRPRDGRAELVARLTFEDWAKLAVN